MRTYTEGTRAYLDTYSGMIPCIVIAVREHCNGERLGNTGDVRVKLTVDRAAYRKGEEIDACALRVVPRKHRINRGTKYRINTQYRFVPNNEGE